MNIENIFTVDELALIDSGNYKPGRAVLDAKLDLACAMEREACAKYFDEHWRETWTDEQIAEAIRARKQE